jgi:hypothetical protein
MTVGLVSATRWGPDGRLLLYLGGSNGERTPRKLIAAWLGSSLKPAIHFIPGSLIQYAIYALANRTGGIRTPQIPANSANGAADTGPKQGANRDSPGAEE